MTGKELAQLHGTTIAMIRYYARIGLIPPAEARNGKPRQYTAQECDTVELIETLSATGLSRDETIHYIAQREKGATTAQNRMTVLRERRARLMDKADRLNRMVDRMDSEIQMCKEE